MIADEIVKTLIDPDDICRVETDERRYVAYIGPSTAKMLLDRSNPIFQRTRQTADVTQLANEMREGRWKRNFANIIMDKDGNIIDGQHRLQAIQMSETIQKVDLIKGADRNDIMQTIDTGRSRTKSDIVSMGAEDVKNTHSTAATVEFVYRLMTDTIRNTGNAYKFTNAKLAEWIAHNPEQFKQINTLCSDVWRAKGILPPKVYAGMRFVLGFIDPARAEAFFDQLIEGVGMTNDSPVLYIRNLLMTQKFTHKPKDTQKRAVLVIRAWNDFVTTGKRIKRYYHSKDVALPAINGLGDRVPYNVPPNWIR